MARGLNGLYRLLHQGRLAGAGGTSDRDDLVSGGEHMPHDRTLLVRKKGPGDRTVRIAEGRKAAARGSHKANGGVFLGKEGRGRDIDMPPLAAGEIVTTGTLTDAWPVRPGDTWSSDYGALAIPGIVLCFT